MQSNIEQLDQYLSALRPDFYAQLNAPLSVLEIEALEKQYQRPLPEDLKALYQWRNGQPDAVSASFVNNAMFLPLGEVLRIAQMLTGMIGYDFKLKDWWNEAWLPLFHNGGGSYICYDTAGIFSGKVGQILYFDKGYEIRKVLAPSLAVFLDALNAYYASTTPADFDGFFAIKAVLGYPLGYLVKEKLKKKKK